MMPEKCLEGCDNCPVLNNEVECYFIRQQRQEQEEQE